MAEHYSYAELYYAYDLIHQAAASSFHSVFATTLFNAARFLLMRLAQVGCLLSCCQEALLKPCTSSLGASTSYALPKSQAWQRLDVGVYRHPSSIPCCLGPRPCSVLTTKHASDLGAMIAQPADPTELLSMIAHGVSPGQ